MKFKLFPFAAIALIMATLFIGQPAYAATSFGTTSVTTDIVSEDYNDLFENPYCFYEGTGINAGIEVWGEKDQTGLLPSDGTYKRDLLFVNNTDKNLEINLSGDPTVSGTFAAYTEGQLVGFHPNPLMLKLYPGETARVNLCVDFGNKLNKIKKNLSGKLTVSALFTVSATDNGAGERLDDFTLNVSSTMKYYTTAGLNAMNRTARIYGYVKTTAGKAIKNATVTISNGLSKDITVKTNAKGYYSVKVLALQDSYYGSYHASSITISKDGYATQKTLIYPADNTKTKKNITLRKSGTALTYKQTKVYNMGIQGNYYDFTPDGRVIAAVPFHSALNAEKIAANSNLVIFNKTGKIYASVALGAETPCIEVSDDGQYIVTQKEEADESYSTTIICDVNGNVVYSRNEFPVVGETFSPLPQRDSFVIKTRFREAALTSDNKYLIIGSMEGDIYCIDWANDAIIWMTNIRNQVRSIDFSKDGKLIYMSSGDGYMYCYDMEGSFLWKTYIGSWAFSVSVGEKYLAVSTKSPANSLRMLDARTGEQYWCYNTPGLGYLALSPDESMVYYGNSNVTAYGVEGSQVFNTATGKVKYLISNCGQSAAWSSDGKYLVAKSPTDIYVCNAKTGEVLWTRNVTDYMGGNTVLYISDNGKYIVAGFNKVQGLGKLYFYKKK